MAASEGPRSRSDSVVALATVKVAAGKGVLLLGAAAVGPLGLDARGIAAGFLALGGAAADGRDGAGARRPSASEGGAGTLGIGAGPPGRLKAPGRRSAPGAPGRGGTAGAAFGRTTGTAIGAGGARTGPRGRRDDARRRARPDGAPP